ncbi:hypothetical protein XBP1_490003 [Xenorhabdus bovienii str. puntauvense]|uniref:Uncharacterized protein n=4 Tax=Xenorhabdus bovienii TaxID=40576 RepID=A0A0B6XC24_XENBV|nr:hypothetical protein XBFFR1_2520013 [Xenorhabdus bovienii str. feltiae France]CDG94453.1 hypothetical protein XBFFL1_580013 [Xenorhabdus bovienii str. feltiae Florida]CDG98703.1 hypothetical protein XBP1_490003 [Xenorhabdus bovienii str. puntauvense]CDH02283.1 hypothetical protein XBFM1_260011 [Xenorhabdus bovienii str. feltiae Moldova]CDH24325.1 hypothetical protein XBKB1_2620013 [Xenorhabdus bovienii str. kraussei Becker Underwood]CDM90278.1 protein of unknown function [Xenorhabdus bovien
MLSFRDLQGSSGLSLNYLINNEVIKIIFYILRLSSCRFVGHVSKLTAINDNWPHP